MKARPMLMSAPMVRAILAGTKTQTRRVVKPQFVADAMPVEMPATDPAGGWVVPGHSGTWWCEAAANPDDARRCPYGQPGDRLWVREAFVLGWPLRDDGIVDQFDEHGNEKPQKTFYRATSPDLEWCDGGDDRPVPTPWKPSMFMPRWASRITLEVASVRVERLQDINREDAIAEGVRPLIGSNGPNYWTVATDFGSVNAPTAQHCYELLWNLINGHGSWDANPWVWVIEFKRLEVQQ